MLRKKLTRSNQAINRLKPLHLLIAAAVFHLIVALAVSVLGHYQVLPGAFDPNGIAVVIASDGVKARAEAVLLSQELSQGHLRTWFQAPSPFYIKLYSISYATFGLVFGTSVFGVEPVNGLCYLAILVLVFYLAREFSGTRPALVTAAIVALWPSFLLHTTQLLKDPLFIAGMLALVLISVRLLSREFSWRSAILTALAGGAAATLAWLARDTAKEILIAIPVLACLLFPIRMLFKQNFSRDSTVAWRTAIPSFVGLILLVALSFGVTRVIPQFKRRDTDPSPFGKIWTRSRQPVRDPILERQTASHNPLTRLIARIGKSRQAFASEFSDAGSNIDTEVSIRTAGDAIRYLPRAVMVGSLAPFPNMWLGTGHYVSRSGRLLSGAEMAAIYMIEALALVGLWNGRRSVSVWFVWLISVIGLTSLGLVVPNVGAIYRLRYVFVMLLIVLATAGAQAIFQRFGKDVTKPLPQ